DVLPVLARDAEHLGDHRERDDGGDRLDEVHRGAIGHARERLVDDPTDRRPLGLERLRRELLAQEIAVPAVLGRVHVEQMAEWRGVGGRLLFGKDPEPRRDDEPPVVAQDGAAVLVAGDRPEGQHPRGLEPGDGRVAPEPRPGGVRVAVAAVVERVDDLPADDGAHAPGHCTAPARRATAGHPRSVNERTLVGSAAMNVSDRAPVAVVVGVGAGLGAALARRFAQGYRVALVARSADFTRTLAAEIKSAGGIPLAVEGDATIPTQVSAAYERIGGELGTPEVLIYNGGRRPFGVLVETTPEVFEETWRVHAFGAFLWARQVVPAMLERHRGAILITGATAGVKPGPNSAAFGPAKFAVRGLAQVRSRDLHPQGIHVAYANVDGAIDMPLIRQLLPQAKDEDLLKPSAIADAFW